MEASELRKTFADYRHAVEVLRDDELPQETRDKAGEDMLTLRQKMDEALVEDKEERELAELDAAVESRERAARIVAAMPEKAERPGALPVEEIRSFAKNKNLGRVSFEVMPETEARTEYDVSTAASGAYGSYLVPQTWAQYVITEEVAASGVLEAGPTIVRTASGGQMNFPKLSTDIAATAGTEGSDATQDTPIFTTVPLNNYRIDGYVVLTEEMLRDTEIDLNSYLGRLAGRALGTLMAGYLGDIDVGTGSSAPAAITVGVTSAATCASATACTVAELKSLYYSVLRKYRKNGKWIANAAETLRLAQATNDNGDFVWQPSNMANAPEVFMGKPWIQDDYFDASAASNIPVVFGDVAQAFLVRLIGPIDIAFSREVNFKSFEVVMRYGQWFDSVTVDSIAVKGLTLSS